MSMRRPLSLSVLVLAAILTAGCGGAAYTTVEVSSAPLADSISITMDAGTSVTAYASATDDDGDYLTFELIDPPDHGYLTFYPASGRFVYTPLPGFIGYDHFSYRASDGVYASNVAAVEIFVEPLIIIVSG
jgi:hypothetical protein